MLTIGAYYELTVPYSGIDRGRYRLLYSGPSFLLLQKSRYHMIMVDLDVTPFLNACSEKEGKNRSTEKKQSLHLLYH